MTTGTVTIGVHTLELPEEDARALFLIAATVSRRGGAVTISRDTTVIVGSSTPVSITITDGFANEYDPIGELDRITMPKAKPAIRYM